MFPFLVHPAKRLVNAVKFVETYFSDRQWPRKPIAFGRRALSPIGSRV
jgi:hypothetical protein